MNLSKRVNLPGRINLASERLGAQVVSCSDDFFASKDNLIKDSVPVFLEEKYTDHGKWMDGWESRRKRGQGFDWCVIKLAFPGEIDLIDIDTSYFLGNHPPFASLEGCSEEEIIEGNSQWYPILEQAPLRPGDSNLFPCTDPDARQQPTRYIRLNIYPDGGVARLKIWGRVRSEEYLKNLGEHKKVNLLGLQEGAQALAASDSFFSPMEHLLYPGSSKGMNDGWETRRKRISGHDWVILKLAHKGIIESIVLETDHFKGNYPAACSLDYCDKGEVSLVDLIKQDQLWAPLMAEQKLNADQSRAFTQELVQEKTCTYLRLNIIPDGGIARIRAFGYLRNLGGKNHVKRAWIS